MDVGKSEDPGGRAGSLHAFAVEVVPMDNPIGVEATEVEPGEAKPTADVQHVTPFGQILPHHIEKLLANDQKEGAAVGPQNWRGVDLHDARNMPLSLGGGGVGLLDGG